VRASTTTPMVKGYISFQNDQMEVAVLEGGQLQVVNAQGQQVIEAGNKLMIQKVQAALGGGGAGSGGGIGPLGWVGIGLGTAGAIGAAAAIGSGGGGGGGGTSPFTP